MSNSSQWSPVGDWMPLAPVADDVIGKLARSTGASALAQLNGATLLCERAMLGNLAIPGRTSAGGGCRLFDAVGDTVAINLARPADCALLPALFQTDQIDFASDQAIERQVMRSDAAALVKRGRSMGLAIASEREMLSGPATISSRLTPGLPAVAMPRIVPRVIDLSALWAGPLAAHLLWLAGAEVVKVESRTRPDAMRVGDERFYALLNQGKASVALDFADAGDRQILLSLIAASDIVIEAARPRALVQLGIDAAQMVRTTPGLVWLTITGHGAHGESAGWIGFGDDCGVAGGLSAALRAASGCTGFVGDAIADPLTGMFAAFVGWEAWRSQCGGRFGIAMSHVARCCLTWARENHADQLDCSLMRWSAAAGKHFPTVDRRPAGPVASFGEDTRFCLELISQRSPGQ
jgi:hypothetical protein